jgi:DNA-binding response OmpR family regulator
MAHGLHVLVVDGELAARNQIAGMLEAAGHAVSVADDGIATARALSSQTFDVVVSASDPPRAALLDETRRHPPPPPVIAVQDAPTQRGPLLAALRDLADSE